MQDTGKTAMLEGGCLCGAVRYEGEDAFLYAMHCHCSQCRRATGAAFKTFGGIGAESLRLLPGSGPLMRYGDAEAHDLHCSACGSLLWSSLSGGTRLHVTYGTLAATPAMAPQCHIFTGSGAGWYRILDDLPQYDGFPT